MSITGGASVKLDSDILCLEQSGLKNLNLSFNLLKSLTIPNILTLTRLDLQNNLLGCLEFKSELPRLTHLNVENNALTNLDFVTKMPMLSRLCKSSLFKIN